VKVFSHRERQMLAGLFLSKFSKQGLNQLGFKSFTEAYNAIGYALDGKPNSIKNYMQEFDPLFPNGRKGWHGREVRQDRKEFFERFGPLSLEELTGLLSPLLLKASPVRRLPDSLREIEALDENALENESVSKRLITGLSAERFFAAAFPTLAEFAGHKLRNVSRFACGFDFRIQPLDSDRFLAAEVKGMAGPAGEIMMTPKEHRVAEYLGERYFLCVGRNFSEKPTMSIYRNPLKEGLEFVRRERKQTIETWHARICA
jgi:hypothetical protein